MKKRGSAVSSSMPARRLGGKEASQWGLIKKSNPIAPLMDGKRIHKWNRKKISYLRGSVVGVPNGGLQGRENNRRRKDLIGNERTLRREKH